MKKIILLFFFVAFTLTEAYSAKSVASDEGLLAGLVDSFAVAMVKKDKVWMTNNLNDSCKMYDPSGVTLDKTSTIRTFTQGIYDIKKSASSNKSFLVNGSSAEGSVDYTVEGTGLINGDRMDITGTYKFSLKFKKSAKGWQIAEILIINN